MSLFHLRGMKNLPQELNSIPYLKCLAKFHLDLPILRYSNSPYVTCLRMNPGRGCNPNLEESYLLEYNDSEAETFTQCTLGIYLQPMKVSAPEPSPISRYSKSKLLVLVF